MITEISPANTFFRPVFLGKSNKFSGKSKHFEQPNNFFPERKEIKKHIMNYGKNSNCQEILSHHCNSVQCFLKWDFL